MTFYSTEAPKLNLDGLFGSKEIRVRAGEPLNIGLGICGSPTPTVDWLKDGKPVGSRVGHCQCWKQLIITISRKHSNLPTKSLVFHP